VITAARRWVSLRSTHPTGLVEFFAAKRLELAAKVDHGQLTEQQFTLEADKAYASIQDTERQRDMAAKQK
jgi:hypothetical protein